MIYQKLSHGNYNFFSKQCSESKEIQPSKGKGRSVWTSLLVVPIFVVESQRESESEL